jgi:methionyl-tRNA synthetase
MGIPLPRHLLVHGWWLTTAGEKMSKSLGNTIQPIDYIDRYGADAFRYFVLREMALGQDCNFSQGLFLARYEGELANDLGNLLSRLHRMLQRYCAGIIPGFGPPGEAEEELRRRADATIRAVRRAYGDLEFSRALEQVFALIRETNRYAEVRSPWKLAKREDGDSRQLLGTSLATLAEALRIAAVLLFPAMPTAVGKILGQLGGVALGTWKELAWGDSLPGKAVGEGEILFPRKEEHALPPLP